MTEHNYLSPNRDVIGRLLTEDSDQQLRNELVTLSQASTVSVMEQAKKMLGLMVEYKELRMIYVCAMKEIQTKFDVLNTEFNVRYQRNPINSVHARLKSNASVIDKLNRKNIPFSLNTLEEQIDDMAGIRIICSYIDDIYALADALVRQDDITLLSRKDYISDPKPNGYRSLHLIISVPVFFADQRKDVKVEVQIRTIAMDFWASLEHQLKYKQDIPDQQQIVAQLKQCADTITSIDKQMMAIRHRLASAADAPTDDEVLMQKLMRLDVPIM